MSSLRESLGAPSVTSGPEVEEFANALDECLSPYLAPAEKRERILDLPRIYYETSLRRLSKRRPRRGRSSNDDIDMDLDDGEDRDAAQEKETIRLEREIQIWDLIRRLLPLRYSASRTNTADNRASRRAKPTTGDRVQDFLISDSVAQERHAVLQWLQTSATSGPDIDDLVKGLQANADRGDVIAHGWLHTKSKIKLRKSMTAWPHLLDRQSPSVAESHTNADGAPLVTQLDPDALTRQSRKLEPQDEYFERSIWLGCFEHLRRGSSLETIRDWCQERTEMWRAISMSAMLLPSDGNEAPMDASPESLALWRRMCYGLARQGGADDFERAVYGILSGDISSVERVARTWEDHLFANYNALLRTQLDTFILGQCPPDAASNLAQSFSVFDAVQFHDGKDTIERRLIRTLESRSDIAIQATEPAKALQASYIAKEMDQYLYEQGLLLAEEAPDAGLSSLIRQTGVYDGGIMKRKFFTMGQRQGMRIVTHVYILKALMEQLDIEDGLQTSSSANTDRTYAQQNILASYTDYLRRAGLQELIPLYCSILEPPRRYQVLSHNLIHEEDYKQRMMQLKLIKKAGINVMAFVETQAAITYDALKTVSGKTSPVRELFRIVDSGTPTSRQGRAIKPDFFGDEEDAIEPRHENVIRALEWLALVHEKWHRVFAVGSMVYKYFLRHMHLNAARQLMRRVPFGELVARIMEDEAEPQVDDATFWETLLEKSNITGASAERAMADARSYRDLEAIVKALDNLETIASLVVLSAEMPATNRKFWNNVGDEIKLTKESMQPLLKDWLLSGIAEGDEELLAIRQTYLPETILAYVSALHFAGTGLSRDNLLECMELAAVIAERNSDLTTVFTAAQRMTELVEALAACSKALAIATGEKRAAGGGSKKMREMGWSRDIWSVKS